MMVWHVHRYQRLQKVAEEEGDKADELQVYADFLRIVLEILNCILATNLLANPELVYAMLHQQEIFRPFQVDLPPCPLHAACRVTATSSRLADSISCRYCGRSLSPTARRAFLQQHSGRAMLSHAFITGSIHSRRHALQCMVEVLFVCIEGTSQMTLLNRCRHTMHPAAG